MSRWSTTTVRPSITQSQACMHSTNPRSQLVSMAVAGGLSSMHDDANNMLAEDHVDADKRPRKSLHCVSQQSTACSLMHLNSCTTHHVRLRQHLQLRSGNEHMLCSERFAC